MTPGIQSRADAAFATVVVSRLGRRDYEQTRAAMTAFTNDRDDTTPDALWLCEHPPVYTLGQAGRLEHLRRPVDIDVVRTERGGQITYHGPGQLVAYTLIDLRRRGIKVREFVTLLEATIIETLAAYNMQGVGKAGAPGVYVQFRGTSQKVAALGLKVAGGRSFHGLSLNVAMDLAPYDDIAACGDPDLRSVDLAALGVGATVAEVGDRLAPIFERRLAEASEQKT